MENSEPQEPSEPVLIALRLSMDLDSVRDSLRRRALVPVLMRFGEASEEKEDQPERNSSLEAALDVVRAGDMGGSW